MKITINPSLVIEDPIEGKPVKLNGDNLTLGKAVARALLQDQNNRDPSAIMDNHQLAMELNGDPESLTITNVQADAIRQAVPPFYTPLISGPVLLHLKEAELKETDK